MKLSSLLCLATILMISCKKDEIGGEVLPQTIANTYVDVAYGADAKQKMDVYLPKDRSTASTKVMIAIHGGSWVEGDKIDLNTELPKLQALFPDYAFVNINYRLAQPGINLFPAQENDIKAAIEFIYSKRTEYKISDKYVYLGVSAGAHLALLAGYKYSSPIKPKAIVSFFGPTDMVGMYSSSLTTALGLTQIMGGTPVTAAALYQSSSPINFVNAQSPPTMLLHGGLDALVPVTQATSLQAKLNLNAVVNQYVFYPTEGHSWGEPNLTDSYTKIKAFLTVQVP